MIKKRKNLFKKISIVIGSLAVALCCLFVGVKAESTDYDTGYDDGYQQGLNDAFENIQTYNVFTNFYESAQAFISNNNGQTYQSVKYITFSISNNALLVSNSNAFSTLDTTSYYIDVTLSAPCNIKNVMLNASTGPNPLYLSLEGSQYSFTYTNIDNVGYMWSNNIFVKTRHILLYFKGRTGMSNYFRVYSNGYDTAVESYKNGFEEGKASARSIYEPRIQALNTNIDSLTSQIATLKTQLANSNGWQSMFFAMADTPFKTVQNFLGFDVLGVNLFTAFIGFITILAILWVLKKLIS